MDNQETARVLSEIAETASETLELQEVFHRVATSIRRLIPLDNMGVVRILDGSHAVLHAATFSCEEGESRCTDPEPLTSWSPRLRPRPEPIPRIDDTHEELDPEYFIDAEILKDGVRSALWEPFQANGVFTGGVWVASDQPRAFTDEHQAALRPIAALLGSAVEHWRIWDAERRRRQSLDRLETLLATFAGSLDIREIFQRISEAVQPILPHDAMGLTELDESARTFTIVARAGRKPMPLPIGPIPLTEEESARRSMDFEIIDDIPAQLTSGSVKDRILLETGARSLLRVPVRLWGEVHGTLGFIHEEPSRYGPDHVEVARRLADRVALMLSHARLAEEARLAAEASERAERLEATVATLTRELVGRGRVIGVSGQWKDLMEQVGRVASSGTTVLITGESGTGKEIVSRLIHGGSPRSGKPFVAINCAALPEQLLESELFGHERGAFTGAAAAKVGRIEQAAGGTLFLDEIGEMSPLVQAKLLRVLQEREFQRLGGTRTLRADVRVVAATNRDLATAIARGQFREDLYYRLNVFHVHIPPLRERTEDILPMAEAFLEELGKSMGRPAAGISRDAREYMLAAPWPGNARELRNAIERAVLLCDGGLITRGHLPPMERPAVTGGNGGNGDHHASVTPFPTGGVDLEEVDRGFVEKALAQSRGNKAKAARLLGITRS